MANTPTPHNAAQPKDIAKTVLMPGDPLRARYIADNYLEDVTCFNTVRNMLGFTGTYRGSRVSVMGSGMGMPSMGIYSYELFNFYGVDAIIRVGSAGAISPQLQLKDVVIGMGACTDSDYAAQFELPGSFAPIASFDLLERAVNTGHTRSIPIQVGNILSSDAFYTDAPNCNLRWQKMGVLAVEMEAAALYMNAARAGKQALCLLSISDSLVTGEALSAEERQMGFHQMMEIALDCVCDAGA